jgi:hypothetical protein
MDDVSREGVAVFVLFLTLYAALIENPTALGIAMALCLYTRPDFAIFLVPVIAYRFLINRSALLKTLVAQTTGEILGVEYGNEGVFPGATRIGPKEEAQHAASQCDGEDGPPLEGREAGQDSVFN